LPSGWPHDAIDLGCVIYQYLERESKPTNQWFPAIKWREKFKKKEKN
jgi:hypothetical protein